jgi:hypothetical protein
MSRHIILVIIRHLLGSVTQVIKANFPNMDPYYATGVCCCGRILICRVTVNLHYNAIMKLITNIYNLKISIIWIHIGTVNFNNLGYRS